MRRIRFMKSDGNYTKWFGYNPESLKRIFDTYECMFAEYETNFTVQPNEVKFIEGYIRSTQDK